MNQALNDANLLQPTILRWYVDDLFIQLDGSLPANPVNDRRVANAVTLKSTFCLPQKSAIIQKNLIIEPPKKLSQNICQLNIS